MHGLPVSKEAQSNPEPVIFTGSAAIWLPACKTALNRFVAMMRGIEQTCAAHLRNVRIAS